MDIFGRRLMDADFDSDFSRSIDDDEVMGALAYVKRWAEEYSEDSNGFYIASYNPGRCKTSLLACVYNRFTKNSYSVDATNVYEMLSQSRSSRYREAPVLLIDDIGINAFSGYKGDEENAVLYEIINARYNNNLTTCFTSNYTFQQLAEDRGILKQTVDRIKGLTAGNWITIKGDSIRSNKDLSKIEKSLGSDTVKCSRNIIPAQSMRAKEYLEEKRAERRKLSEEAR